MDLVKIAAKIQKMHFFSKKMQKNFGSSKISSTFAAGFAQKTTSGVKNDLWNNEINQDVVQVKLVL